MQDKISAKRPEDTELPQDDRREKMIIDHLDRFAPWQKEAVKMIAKRVANWENNFNGRSPLGVFVLIGSKGSGIEDLVSGTTDFVMGNPNFCTKIDLGTDLNIPLEERLVVDPMSSAYRLAREAEVTVNAIDRRIELLKEEEKKIRDRNKKKEHQAIMNGLIKKAKKKAREAVYLNERSFGGEPTSVIWFSDADKAPEQYIPRLKRIIEDGIYITERGVVDLRKTFIFITCEHPMDGLMTDLRIAGLAPGYRGKHPPAAFEFENAMKKIGKIFPTEILAAAGKENVAVLSEIGKDTVFLAIERALSAVPFYLAQKGIGIKVFFTEEFKFFLLDLARSPFNKRLGISSIERIIQNEVIDRVSAIARDRKKIWKHKLFEGNAIEFFIKIEGKKQIPSIRVRPAWRLTQNGGVYLRLPSKICS